MRNETIGSYIYYLSFPLLSSLPYTLNFYKQNSCYNGNYKIYVNCLASFAVGSSVIVISLLIDYWMLSMITESFCPEPNDMTTLYNSTKPLSVLFFEHPGLFIIVWSTLESLWGGAFSLLSMAICVFLKKKMFSVPMVMVIYFLNYIFSIKINITPWRHLLYAGSIWPLSIKGILLNIVSIVLFSVILLIFAEENDESYKN